MRVTVRCKESDPDSLRGLAWGLPVYTSRYLPRGCVVVLGGTPLAPARSATFKTTAFRISER